MSLSRAAKNFLSASGAPQVARGAVEVLDTTRAKALKVARSLGATDAQIRKLTKALDRGETMQSALSILFPFIPSPVALRRLAAVDGASKDVRSRRRAK